MKKILAACAALTFGTVGLHAQVLLNINITSPNTMVITATGVGPVTDDSSHYFDQGIDLEGLFIISDNGGSNIPVITSTLTTGDTSTGPVYDSAYIDSESEAGADLNLYQFPAGQELSPSQTFTYGLPAFAVGTSITVNFSGLTFSGIDYGVILAGYSNNDLDGGAPETPDVVSNAGIIPLGGTTPIGVYHVVSVAAPEPSTYALMLGGLVLLGFAFRRKLA